MEPEPKISPEANATEPETPQTPPAFISNPEPNTDPIPMPNPFASQPTKKNNKTAIILACVLLVLALGIGAYFLFFNKPNSATTNQSQNATKQETSNQTKTDSNNSEEENQESSSTSNFTTSEKHSIAYLGELECYIIYRDDGTVDTEYCDIPSSLIINDTGETVYHIFPINDPELLTPENVGSIEGDGSTYTVAISADVYTYYGDNKTATVSFDQEVIHYGIGGFGQAVGDECAFFVLADGSLHYLKLANIAKGQTDAKKIEGVESVTTLMNGSTHILIDDESRSFGAGGHNVFAVRNDGKVYALFNYISE